MFAKIFGDRIISYSEKNEFKKRNKFKIIETDKNINEFSVYVNGEIKTPSVAKTKELRLKLELDRKNEVKESIKENIIDKKFNKKHLLNKGTWEQILEYRSERDKLNALESNKNIDEVIEILNKQQDDLQAIGQTAATISE